MEPSAGIELPPPVHQELSPVQGEHPLPINAEHLPTDTIAEKPASTASVPEKASQPPTTNPINDDQSDDQQDSVSAPQVVVSALKSIPPAAGDSDRIEPGWVETAQQVIAETRQDPYQQEAAFDTLRQEYHQKRSNAAPPRAA